MSQVLFFTSSNTFNVETLGFICRRSWVPRGLRPLELDVRAEAGVMVRMVGRRTQMDRHRPCTYILQALSSLPTIKVGFQETRQQALKRLILLWLPASCHFQIYKAKPIITFISQMKRLRLRGDLVICPRTHNQEMRELGFALRWSDSQVHGLIICVLSLISPICPL